MSSIKQQQYMNSLRIDATLISKPKEEAKKIGTDA